MACIAAPIFPKLSTASAIDGEDEETAASNEAWASARDATLVQAVIGGGRAAPPPMNANSSSIDKQQQL
jgi:hypothetical protein